MMGGEVVLTSEESVGSVFTLSVPRECPEYNEDDVDSMLSTSTLMISSCSC